MQSVQCHFDHFWLLHVDEQIVPNKDVATVTDPAGAMQPGAQRMGSGLKRTTFISRRFRLLW